MIGTGVYLPRKTLTNDDIEKKNVILPSGRQLRADQIFEKIGVERRHIAGKNETAADLGYKAALIALDKAKPEVVLSSTSHPSKQHTAKTIKDKLGLKNVEVMDFHAACSGSALMFSYLFENIKRLRNKQVLLVASEKFSQYVIDLSNPDAVKLDSSLGQTIFGDGAAAVSFKLGGDLEIHSVINRALPEPGGKTDLIYMAMGENKFIEPCVVNPVATKPAQTGFENGYFTQNGPKVFEVIQNTIPQTVRDAVKKAGLKPEDIDLVVLHPGSKRLFDALKTKLEPDFEAYTDYKDGNMSSVSLLYSFVKALNEGRIGSGSKVVLSGFGAGSPDLYSSSVVIELN